MDNDIVKCCLIDGLKHEPKLRIDLFDEIITCFDMILPEEGFQDSATETIVVIHKIHFYHILKNKRRNY